MKTTVKPRGRPRKFDEAQILDVARDLFWRQGYEGTSLKDLTAAMGITPPSLYAAFGSKEGLYRRALDRYAQTYGAQLLEGMAEERDLKRAFARLIENCVTQFGAGTVPPGCMISTGLLGCAPENDAVARDLTARRMAMADLLHARLQADRDQLPPDTDLASLANYFAMSIEGLSVQARDGLDRAQLAPLAAWIMAAWPG
jgi:AcrR family transcriptional regulator